ncbi:High-affinity zinc uptake system protein ZnuA precursor [Cognatishimia activa]|uniref:High-affinity zinc uptake system protein ZnuA n=2 Tax=Cognatishimia activa TaxID=1715691 RepID=A0A0P1ILE9_9RHOB|nr:High-affinity zinc uptake system protein ZnuA precursor [Cognatishimia activa]CUK24453.1 High-affinity zinc uptake system protein ZnuA precursor [Cognatishimia activa]
MLYNNAEFAMLFRSMTAIGLMATQAQADVPNVVADIAPIHSLVARVMQGVGEPTMIMQQGASPHGYTLRPSEAAALQDADVVFWVGEELSPWLEDAVENLARDAHSVELLHTEGTNLLNFREEVVFGEHGDHDDHGHEDKHADHDHGHGHDDHHGEENHADHDEHGHEEGHKDHDDHHDEHKEEHAGHDDHGHDHDGADPHAWLSPDNAINWLKVIAEELSEHDQANAELYATNAAAGATEIAAASEAIAAKLAPMTDGRYLVFHDAYQYFEATYGIQATGSLHLSDATPPSAARLVELQEEIKEHGISCVFAEPQFNDDLVAAITPEGTNRGILDPLATDIPAGPALYTAWLNGMAQAVVDCIK